MHQNEVCSNKRMYYNKGKSGHTLVHYYNGSQKHTHTKQGDVG